MLENVYKTPACQRWHTTRTSNLANYDQLSKNIAKAIKYIEEYFAKENLKKENKCTLKEVAKEVGSSRSVFWRLFKQEVGMTFQNYKDEVCIDKAKCLLKNEDFNIEKIASLCEYGTSSGFRRVFKAAVGVSSTEYRSKHRTK